MTMTIQLIAGDVADIAPDEAEAALMWEPLYVGHGPWERLCNKCPDLILRQGEADVVFPWYTDTDTLWEMNPPLRQGPLRYLYAFTNPEQLRGCIGLDQFEEVAFRGLDRLASLGVRRVAVHIPVFEKDRFDGRMENKKCIEGMTNVLRKWDESHPGQIEKALLIGKIFHFPDPLEVACPNGANEAVPFPRGNDPERPISLSIHGSWMLMFAIEELAKEPSEWKTTALKDAVKLRDWSEAVDPGYLESTIETMSDLIRTNECAQGTDDASTRRCGRFSIQSCDLNKLNRGNDTEFPYPLSLAGAWILLAGIQEYAQSTREWYAVEFEDAGYCRLRAMTALDVAEKLRQWVVGAAADDGKMLAQELERLTQMLTIDKDKLESLADEERRVYDLQALAKAGVSAAEAKSEPN